MPQLDSFPPCSSDGDWTATDSRRFVLTHYDDVLTVNKERTGHWSSRASVTKAWREAFTWLARIGDIPTDGTLRACHVDAVPLAATRRRQDVGACLPVVKAAIDGLVDAGVWIDDDPDHVLSIRFWPQQLAADAGLRLVVTESSTMSHPSG